MTLIYIFFAILLFGVLIAVHEFGHFSVAKLCGVRVEEFSLGMGPQLLHKKVGETVYSLRLLPLGGFCAMTGENEASDDPRALMNAKPWKKLLILCAGSFNNFLLGFLIILCSYMSAEAFRAPVIHSFFDNCPYRGESMLMEGDRFYRIDGKRVYMYYDVSDFLAEGNGTYDMVLIRDGHKVQLKDFHFVPIEYEGQDGKFYGFRFGYEEATLGAKLRYSWYNTMEFARWVWMGLRELFQGKVQVSEMSGVVGIVDTMAETGNSAASVGEGLMDILFLGAFITVNLGIMNMLPIPALDGGRVFLLLVTYVMEMVLGRKIDPKYEAYIHAGGMFLLLALMGFIMFQDIFKIVTG